MTNENNETGQANRFTAEVIQFKRPHGVKVYTSTELPIKVQSLYLEMMEQGCRFEAEVLITDHVSVTISDPVKECDLDISITANGPDIQKGMIAMLERKQWSDASNLNKVAADTATN